MLRHQGGNGRSGGPAAEEAVTTAQQFGADLRQHSTQPVTPDMIAQADYLLTMTHGHLRLLVDMFPRLASMPRLLCPEGDIPDPIGAGPEVYQACASEIMRHLERFVPEVQP